MSSVSCICFFWIALLPCVVHLHALCDDDEGQCDDEVNLLQQARAVIQNDMSSNRSWKVSRTGTSMNLSVIGVIAKGSDKSERARTATNRDAWQIVREALLDIAKSAANLSDKLRSTGIRTGDTIATDLNYSASIIKTVANSIPSASKDSVAPLVEVCGLENATLATLRKIQAEVAIGEESSVWRKTMQLMANRSRDVVDSIVILHEKSLKASQAISPLVTNTRQSSYGEDVEFEVKLLAAEIARLSLHVAISLLDAATPGKYLPGGSDIWNTSVHWVSVRRWHPAGVVSNINNGKVRWASVAYVDMNILLVLSLVAYPIFALMLVSLATICVGMLLSTKDTPATLSQTYSFLPGDYDAGGRGESSLPTSGNIGTGEPSAPTRPPEYTGDPPASGISVQTRPPGISALTFTSAYSPPIMARESLSSFSKSLYSYWASICLAFPAAMVFGIPLTLAFLAIPYPQEIFAILTLVTSFLVFCNGAYMVIYGIASMPDILPLPDQEDTASPERQTGAEAASAQHGSSSDSGVMHWVLLPQYKESAEVVSMCLGSIAACSFAKTSISVVLAMEQREDEAADKAEELRTLYLDAFAEVLVTYHPANLPDDPPGKASNLKWAYESLVQHLLVAHGNLDELKVLLTVSDADSEFHVEYFNELDRLYMTEDPESRNLRLWQAPMLHMKNYHSQPGPIIPGTIFTTLTELSLTSDSNSVRFPYSTYSLSLELARRVGGWDAQWIAEDWHMGLKCYLFTLGHATVRCIPLATMNYMPEDDTWLTTIFARWAQAKRHALGFSDLAYFYMTVPLVLAHVSTGQRAVSHLRAFWGMFFGGTMMMVRLINVHVVVGMMVIFGFMTWVLRLTMWFVLEKDRSINKLWARTEFFTTVFMVTSALVVISLSFVFFFVYNRIRDRCDEKGKDGVWLRNWFMHWLSLVLAFACWGPFYFLGLAVTEWIAAWKTLRSPVFEYEVAPKPKRGWNESSKALANAKALRSGG